MKLSKNFVWNSIAGIINAGEAVILMMVITRTVGTEMAGIVTLGFAVGNLMRAIGLYTMRTYQATDLVGKYSFDTYFSSRVYTVLAMGLASVLYAYYEYVVGVYSLEKMLIVLLICAIYMVECMEDVFWGLYQIHDSLYLGCICFSLRWVATLVVISGMLVFGVDMVWALTLGFLVGLLIMVVFNGVKAPDFIRLHLGSDVASLRLVSPAACLELLTICFPLFASGFLTMYLTNAPKYAINRYLSDTAQACYGFVAMPVFVVALLNSFIYQPMMVSMTEKWNGGKKKAFLKDVSFLMGCVVALTLCTLIGAYFLGVPVLSWRYSTDLAPYKTELLVLLVGGGLLGVVGVETAIMTIMRIQRYLILGYAVSSILAAVVCGFMVATYGLMGAALIYDALELILALFLGVPMCYYLAKTPERA